MPIYEYRCDSCGFQKEYIQRMSDAQLTDCPECKKSTFSKMVTAAGFQLKGGGWYVTDFKGGNAGAKKTESKQSDTPSGDSGKSESAKPESKSESSASAAPSTPAAASTSTTSTSSN